MLTIFNQLKKNKIIRVVKKGNIIRVHKRNIPLNKEWYNGIYSFNKNSLRFLPAVHANVFTLLKRYFNITSKWLQEKTSNNRKMRLTSGRKIWISNPEIKHTYDKINITVYIYNRTYDYYKKKLELFRFKWGPLTSLLKLKRKPGKSYQNKKTIELITRSDRIIKREYPNYLGKKKVLYAKTNDFYVNMIKWLKLDKYTVMTQYKLTILNLLETNDKSKLIKMLNLLKIQHHNYLLTFFKKELTYLKFKQKTLYNEFKYSEVYLTPIINMLQTIYKKKVEFNLVTLKYYHLSSSILSQIISTKIKAKRFRGRPLLPVYSAINKLKIPLLTKSKLSGESKPFIDVQNVIFTNDTLTRQDHLDQFLLVNNTKSKIWSTESIDKLALGNIENKGVAGIFVKIAGRLTKRYKAQRAVSRLRSKGTLKNVYSAHRNLSSALSKGYSNINVEKTMVSSKLRIGAFGLTGWVASY